MIPIKIGRNSYKSISEAWREESPKGLKEITVRQRLRDGWPAKIAFKCPAIAGPDRASKEQRWIKANRLDGVLK